jgi:hypothetical protein
MINLFLLVFLVLLQIGDVVTTKIILDKGGREINGVMRYFFNKFGVDNALVGKVVVVSAIGFLSLKYFAFMLLPFCLLYVGVVGWNTYQIFKSK